MDLHPSPALPALPSREQMQVRKGALPPVTSHATTPEWVRALQVIVKHWRLSAAFALIVVVVAAIVTFSMRPIFEPVARIEVDPPGEAFSLEGGAPVSDGEYLETQAQNMKSDRLAI